MLLRALPLAAIFLLASALLAQTPTRHPKTLDDLARWRQVSRPVLSPDGKWIAYTLRHVDAEADKNVSNLWMVSWDGAEQMYQALRDVGTPAELIVYPDQFHGFTRPSFIRDRYQRWSGWYDKYLGLTPPKPAAAAR